MASARDWQESRGYEGAYRTETEKSKDLLIEAMLFQGKERKKGKKDPPMIGSGVLRGILQQIGRRVCAGWKKGPVAAGNYGKGRN